MSQTNSVSVINDQFQTETAVRCSIILPAGDDPAKLTDYLHYLSESKLTGDYELIIVAKTDHQIDERRLRALLPALKVLNVGRPSRQEELLDVGARAASGRFLLFVRNFIKFDMLVLEEAIKDLETSGEKVSISANKNFLLVERLYYKSAGGFAGLFRRFDLEAGGDNFKFAIFKEKDNRKHGKVRRYVAKFDSTKREQFCRYEAKLAKMSVSLFIEKYSDRCHGKLVDVGCGSKAYRKYFIHIDEYIGVDLASGKADIIADAKCMPIESNSVDVVLCNQVIEHDAEPVMIIAEIHRILKKDGFLILSAPQMARLHGEPHDYYRFTKWGLNYLLEKNGMKIEVIEPRGGFFRAIGSHLNFFIIEYFGKNKLRRYLLRRTIIALNNLIFSFLDKLINWEKDTLGYNIIAKKRGY